VAVLRGEDLAARGATSGLAGSQLSASYVRIWKCECEGRDEVFGTSPAPSG
jgi:hypothetical protein